MTPVRHCLHNVAQTAAIADPPPVERILEALTALEAAYARPSERIVALEAVLQEFERSPLAGQAALARVLRIAVDRRQSFWARRSGTRSGVTAAAGAAEARRVVLQASPV